MAARWRSGLQTQRVLKLGSGKVGVLAGLAATGAAARVGWVGVLAGLGAWGAAARTGLSVAGVRVLSGRGACFRADGFCCGAGLTTWT